MEKISNIKTDDINSISSFTDNVNEFIKLPTEEQISSIDWSSIGSIVTTFGVILIVIMFSFFVLWLIRAIGLYTMARNKNDDLAWTAFVPFACLFTTGRIVGDTSIYGIKIFKTEWLLPLFLLIMCLPIGKEFTILIFIVAYYGLLYRLYQNQNKSFAGIFLILSILLPFLQPFFIFFLRNKNKINDK
ncbi:MAG: hypothetical protein RSF67_07995, partial [Clostridia bacterium]